MSHASPGRVREIAALTGDKTSTCKCGRYTGLIPDHTTRAFGPLMPCPGADQPPAPITGGPR